MKCHTQTNLERIRQVSRLLTWTTVAALGCATAGAEEASTSTNSVPPVTETHPARRFGAGLIVGEPTGVSLKCFLSRTVAIDGGVGWSFDEDTDMQVHSDVLFHRHGLAHSAAGDLAGYVGVGGRVQVRDQLDDRFGIRVPLGLSYTFQDAPVDIFGEVAPVIDVSPSVRGDFTAGIGARYWF